MATFLFSPLPYFSVPTLPLIFPYFAILRFFSWLREHECCFFWVFNLMAALSMPGFLSFMAAVLCKAVLYLLFGFGRGFEEEVPLLCVGSKNGLAVARQVLPILSGQVLGCRWRILLSLSSSHISIAPAYRNDTWIDDQRANVFYRRTAPTWRHWGVG